MTLPRQKTKIVCTLGPASSDEETIRRMIRAGMSVARLNFSHGTLEEHARQIGRVRRAAAAEDRVIGILIDLPGPKIRLGLLPVEPLEIERGAEVVLTTDPSPGGSDEDPGRLRPSSRPWWGPEACSTSTTGSSGSGSSPPAATRSGPRSWSGAPSDRARG